MLNILFYRVHQFDNAKLTDEDKMEYHLWVQSRNIFIVLLSLKHVTNSCYAICQTISCGYYHGAP